jgi:hypothetical protein
MQLFHYFGGFLNKFLLDQCSVICIECTLTCHKLHTQLFLVYVFFSAQLIFYSRPVPNSRSQLDMVVISVPLMYVQLCAIICSKIYKKMHIFLFHS